MGKRTAIRPKHAPAFYIIFAAVTFFVGVFSTIVYTNVFAQGPDVIYACVQKVSGNMRIVPAGENCKSNETALNWNQQGPQGDPGSSGSGASLPFSCSYCVLYPIADKFKGKDLSYAQIWRSEFQGADLTGIIFKGANIATTNFSNANLTNADFSGFGNYPGWGPDGVNFNTANLSNANFTNANLRGARNMSTANVTGVIWSNTTCPDGTNSDSNGNTCDGHL